jgi:DNA-binding MarR family transcriptional regulator
VPEDLPWLDLDSRILLAIYMAGRVRAGVRELADELDYSSGRVSERLRALLERGT